MTQTNTVARVGAKLRFRMLSLLPFLRVNGEDYNYKTNSPFLVYRLRSWEEILYLCLVIIASANLVIAHASLAKPFLDIEEYMQGLSKTPFQFRILTSWLALPIAWLIDQPLIVAALGDRPPPFDDANMLSIMMINMFALIGLSYLLRFHLGSLIGRGRISTYFGLGIFLILPSNLVLFHQSNYWLPYDIISMVLFYLVFLIGVSERWLLFFLVFIFAVLTRETVIFVAGVLFLINLMRYDIVKCLSIFLASIFTWVIIKACLHYLFIDNLPTEVSPFFEFNLQLNLGYFSNPMWWPGILSQFGLTWIAVIFLFRYLRDYPLRIAMLCFPLYFLIMVFLGQIVELRIFLEYVPLIFCAFAQCVVLALRSSGSLQAS